MSKKTFSIKIPTPLGWVKRSQAGKSGIQVDIGATVCPGEAGGRSILGERTQHNIWKETNKVRREGSVTLKQRDIPGTR